MLLGKTFSTLFLVWVRVRVIMVCEFTLTCVDLHLVVPQMSCRREQQGTQVPCKGNGGLVYLFHPMFSGINTLLGAHSFTHRRQAFLKQHFVDANKFESKNACIIVSGEEGMLKHKIGWLIYTCCLAFKFSCTSNYFSEGQRF